MAFAHSNPVVKIKIMSEDFKVKTLIINGSPRKNGNTVTLLNELKKHLKGEVFQVDTYYAMKFTML